MLYPLMFSEWYKAAQGLFAFGIVIVLAALPIGCANLCCGSFTITRVIGVLLLIACKYYD